MSFLNEIIARISGHGGVCDPLSSAVLGLQGWNDHNLSPFPLEDSVMLNNNGCSVIPYVFIKISANRSASESW